MERARVKVGVSLATLLLLLLTLGMPAFAKPNVLELVLIDNFDDPEAQRWAVYGSKFSNTDFPQVTYVNAFPEALYGRFYEGAEDRQALGVRARWDRRGYNYVEIVPVAEGDDGELVSSPIPLRGVVSRLDMWVWGANYNYYIEVHLMDHRGVPHNLFLGDLTFQGWRSLSIAIPSTIPQAVRWIPQERPLELTKIVVWTRPSERVDSFYIYFDELKILSDVAENRFDGDELGRPEYLEEVWASARKQGE